MVEPVPGLVDQPRDEADPPPVPARHRRRWPLLLAVICLVALVGEGWWSTRRIPSWPVRHVLLGHTSVVQAVTFSPDGTTVATGSADGTIKLWDVATGRLRRTFDLGRTGGIRPLAFSRDGITLAVGDGGTVKVLDVATGRERATLHPGSQQGHVDDIRFCSDGTLVIKSISTQEILTLWDSATWSPRASPVPRSLEKAAKLAISPDGRRFAASNRDGTVVSVGDIDMGSERTRLKRPQRGGSGPAMPMLSPDGRTMALAEGIGDIELWDWFAGAKYAILKSPYPRLTLQGIGGRFNGGMAFSPDGRFLASVGMTYRRNWVFRLSPRTQAWLVRLGIRDKTIETIHVVIWDVVVRRPVAELRGHDKAVFSLEFSPDGRTLATASDDQTVKLWDVPRK